MANQNPYAVPQGFGDANASVLDAGRFQNRGMYFWRIRQLKADLREQPLSDRESLPYLVAFLALMTAAEAVPVLNYNPWDALGSIWSVALAIIGTIYIYRQNGGSDGRYFLQRYFAVGWVVGLRCMAAIIVCSIGLFAFLYWQGRVTEDTTAVDFLFLAVAEAVVYWRIGHHVGDLASEVAPA